MNLTIDALKRLVADLAEHAPPPKKNVYIHGDTAYLFDDIPDPYFVPLEAPAFKPMVYEPSLIYGTEIINPRNVGLIAHACMALPDARPVHLSREQMLTIPLRTIKRLQGYVVYARAKRVRRENRA